MISMPQGTPHRPLTSVQFLESRASIHGSQHTCRRMTADILEELLLRLQHEDFVIQTQLDDAIQFPDVSIEAVEDVQVSGMLLAPAFERGEFVEICQAKRAIAVRFPCCWVCDVHEPTAEAADFWAVIYKEVHALR